MEKRSSPVRLIVTAFVLGCLAGFTIPFAALRLYVSITHPNIIIVALALSAGGCVGVMSAKSRLATGLIASVCFAAGAYGLMYFMISIYPPTLS